MTKYGKETDILLGTLADSSTIVNSEVMTAVFHCNLSQKKTWENKQKKSETAELLGFRGIVTEVTVVNKHLNRFELSIKIGSESTESIGGSGSYKNGFQYSCEPTNSEIPIELHKKCKMNWVYHLAENPILEVNINGITYQKPEKPDMTKKYGEFILSETESVFFKIIRELDDLPIGWKISEKKIKKDTFFHNPSIRIFATKKFRTYGKMIAEISGKALVRANPPVDFGFTSGEWLRTLSNPFFDEKNAVWLLTFQYENFLELDNEIYEDLKNG